MSELRPGRRGSLRVASAQGYAPGQPFELYDRESDPAERLNAYRPGHPALGEMVEWIAIFDDRGHTEREPAAVTAEQQRALEALGYVDAP